MISIISIMKDRNLRTNAKWKLGNNPKKLVTGFFCLDVRQSVYNTAKLEMNR